MKEFLNKSCKIAVKPNGEILFYLAKQVTDISETHITFIDKYELVLTFRIADVVEIQETR